MSNTKKNSKQPKRKYGKKIFITLLCLIVLAVLGLSIAGNVFQYQKWKELSSAPTLDDGGQPDVEPPVGNPDEQFKPLDSSTPVSLRAGGDGQHLYINTDETALNASKAYADEKGTVFLMVALTSPHSGDFNDLYDIFSGNGNGAFFIIYENDAINIMYFNEDRGNIYDYTTNDFVHVEEKTATVLVSDNGQITLNDTVLEAIGTDTIYIYPLINFISEEMEGDFDKDTFWSVEEIEKLFAFSPFGNQQ